MTGEVSMNKLIMDLVLLLTAFIVFGTPILISIIKVVQGRCLTSLNKIITVVNLCWLVSTFLFAMKIISESH